MNNKTNIGEEIEDTNANALTDNDNDGYFSDEDCDDFDSSSIYDMDCDGILMEDIWKIYRRHEPTCVQSEVGGMLFRGCVR